MFDCRICLGRKCFVLFSIDPICKILSRIQYRTLKWRIPIYRCISTWGRAVFIVFIVYHCHQLTREWFQAIFAGAFFAIFPLSRVVLREFNLRYYEQAKKILGMPLPHLDSERLSQNGCICCKAAIDLSLWRSNKSRNLWVSVQPFCLHISNLSHLKVKLQVLKLGFSSLNP